MRYLDRFFEPKGWTSGVFTNHKGKHVRFGHLEPAGENKGTVVITTGYDDSMESYYNTAKAFVGRGYAVWVMDWAGQGGSDKDAASVHVTRKIEDHVEDLHQFRREIIAADAGKPVFLCTHSMGGQISLCCLQKNPKDFDFAILAAPFVDFNMGDKLSRALKSVFHAAVKSGLGDVALKGSRRNMTHLADSGRTSALPMNVHREFWQIHKGLHAEDPTLGSVDSLFESASQVNQEAFLKSIGTPILFGIGEKDNIVHNDAIRRIVPFIPHAQLVMVKDSSHGLWTERGHICKGWWDCVDAFIEQQVKERPAAPPPAARSQKGGRRHAP